MMTDEAMLWVSAAIVGLASALIFVNLTVIVPHLWRAGRRQIETWLAEDPLRHETEERMQDDDACPYRRWL